MVGESIGKELHLFVFFVDVLVGFVEETNNFWVVVIVIEVFLDGKGDFLGVE